MAETSSDLQIQLLTTVKYSKAALKSAVTPTNRLMCRVTDSETQLHFEVPIVHLLTFSVSELSLSSNFY